MSITEETRREGLQAVSARISPRHALIIAALRSGPKTAPELAEWLGFSDLNSVKPRITELKKAGLVGVVGKRPNAHTGVSNAVYELRRTGL